MVDGTGFPPFLTINGADSGLGEAGARRQIESACGEVFGHRQRRHRLSLVHRQVVHGGPEGPAAISGSIERLEQLRAPCRVGRVEIKRVQPEIARTPGWFVDEANPGKAGEGLAPMGREPAFRFEEARQLFQLPGSGSEVRGSSGLGLGICRELVEAMSGRFIALPARDGLCLQATLKAV